MISSTIQRKSTGAKECRKFLLPVLLFFAGLLEVYILLGDFYDLKHSFFPAPMGFPFFVSQRLNGCMRKKQCVKRTKETIYESHK